MPGRAIHEWPEHLPPPRELLRRVLGSRLLDRVAGESVRPRWSVVRDLTRLESTYSSDLCVALCVALGLTPDEEVGQTSWEALEAVCGGYELTEKDYEKFFRCNPPPVEERYRREG